MDQDQRNRFRHLLIIDDAEGRRTIALEATTYSIGRDGTNSIVLHSKMVSRQHAILLRVTSPDSSNYLFRIIDGDLQGKRSTNGLMINGRKLFSHDLKHGDMLVFGGDVKAKYYAISNLTDSAFDEFCEEKDLSSILSKSVNPFQTLVPTDDDFQSLSEAALVRMASFPELTPSPILEIDLSGVVTYLNPSAVMQFPDLSELGTLHPMMHGLLPMTRPTQPGHRSFFVREVELGDRVYEQSVHYIAESDLVRSYVSDITVRKRAEEQLRHQAQRESIINRIVQAMRGTMVTAEVLQITVGLLVEALEASHCIIVQNNSEGELVNHYVSHTAVGRHDLIQGNERILKLCGEALSEGNQVVLRVDDSRLDLEVLAIAQQCQFASVLITPLIYLQNDLGSISLFQKADSQKVDPQRTTSQRIDPQKIDSQKTEVVSDNLREWNMDERGLVKTIADQCAIAIHQAQLYQRVQDLNADLERQVQERTAQLQQKMQELERLNNLKDDFLSTVSHELRTPMSNIKMAIHMLNQFPLEDRQRRYIDILSSECARETELINDLLDLQRLEAGVNPVGVESLRLQELMPRVLDPFISRSNERGQHFASACDPQLPPLKSDRACLERILAELLNNACKYTPQGGHFSLHVEFVPEPTERVRLIVRNDAEIPEHELPRIFDKFYRVPNADPWKQGGTGLGLALVKRLVEQLQGSIQANSAQGKTTFLVELPITPSFSTDIQPIS
ncbi:MAG: ATP-binding protein [Thermosynechococcaceae cyanobacterium MS004]|nr:ATP-binding protein [Thermosynechococcaceae cyanobacterium MS004]